MNQPCTRIGLCSDTHNWTTAEPHVGELGNLMLQHRASDLQTILLDTLANADLDMVIHLGDFTCGGGYFGLPVEQFYALEESIRRDFAALPMPAYGLPGNHDCPPGGGDWTHFEQLWGLAPDMGLTVDLPQARLVLLHTQGHSAEQIVQSRPADPIYGWVADAELERLDAALAGAGDRPVLLFLHQVLQPWQDASSWWELFGVRNVQPVMDILAHHRNVRAVFQGHAHRYNLQSRLIGGRPCHFVVTPCIIEYPVAWLQLDLTPTHLDVTFHHLPVPDLIELSRSSGAGQDWRAGLPVWHNTRIDLRG